MSMSAAGASGEVAATNLEAVATSMEWDAEEQQAGGISNGYHLSAALAEGHDYAVRDVSSCGNNLIATLEEKGRVAVFERVPADSSGASVGSEPVMEWVRSDRVDPRAHASLAFVLENVEGCAMHGESRGASGSAQTHYPHGTFMSGGGDKAARPWTANGSSFPSLTAHTGPVNSISFTHPERLVLTGAWDGIVRMWHGDQLLKSFDKLGHEHGTEVLGLENGSIVTASTTGHIVIIDTTGKVLHRVAKAHDAPIRKLIAHPLGFASAANDGLIRIWNAQGTLLQTVHAASASEVKFLYGLCFIAGGGGAGPSNLDRSRIVSCGEDGFVRVFDFKGECIQSIPHPGPVRSVAPLGEDPECDFLTACADKTVRVFTRHAARFASPKERRDFKEIGALIKAAGGMKQLDTSTLENESALQKPGTKDGQVKVLNIPGRSAPIAFQWSNDLHEWIEIGETMGSAAGATGSGPQQGRTKYEGKEYDFVSDVYLTDEHVVKLAFNADDDPEQVTERFSTIYQVPADMRQQILDFIRPKCDPAAGARRKAQEAAAAQPKVVLQQVPSWTTGSFETYSQANQAAMEKKLRETNTLLTEQQHEHAIKHEAQLKSFAALFESLRDPTQFHVASFSAGEVLVVKHMLEWPVEHCLAVLDCVRVLMMHAGANAALGTDLAVHASILKLVQQNPKDTAKVLALKIISNWVAKRTRAPSERADPPAVPSSVVEILCRALSALSDAGASESENVALAYVMLLHNIICWYGRLKIAESELYALVAAGIAQLLNHKRNSKIQFYALLTLGSIAYASTSARDVLRGQLSENVRSCIEHARKSDNVALQQVAHDCEILYQLH